MCFNHTVGHVWLCWVLSFSDHPAPALLSGSYGALVAQLLSRRPGPAAVLETWPRRCPGDLAQNIRGRDRGSQIKGREAGLVGGPNFGPSSFFIKKPKVFCTLISGSNFGPSFGHSFGEPLGACLGPRSGYSLGRSSGYSFATLTASLVRPAGQPTSWLRYGNCRYGLPKVHSCLK